MNKNIFNVNSDIYLDYGYLMLPLNLSIISKIKIGSKLFFSKRGYHVSLIRLLDFSDFDQKKILNFAKKYPVKLKNITKIYRLAKEGDRQSIIVRVHLRGLKKLISTLNHHFGYSFAYPPTHITLFTLKDMEGGIGINSNSEYKSLTHQINQKDSQKLSKSFKLLSLQLAVKVIDC
jgi:hypothetical protein